LQYISTTLRLFGHNGGNPFNLHDNILRSKINLSTLSSLGKEANIGIGSNAIVEFKVSLNVRVVALGKTTLSEEVDSRKAIDLVWSILKSNQREWRVRCLTCEKLAEGQLRSWISWD
jgi:hypothetical protein